MHASRIIERDRPGRRGYRFFLWFELPLNPICWLFGHRAKVAVMNDDPTKPYLTPWRRVTCRTCGRRWLGERGLGDISTMLHQAQEMFGRDHNASFSTRELYEARKAYGERIAAGQVEVAKRDPKMVERGVDRRHGWGERKVEPKLEVWFTKPSRRAFSSLGIRFHVGTESSETPWDGHIDVGVFAAYWGLGGFAERLAHWLGRGHKRDIALRVHGGSLWWNLWFDDDGGHDRHHRCDKRRKVWWSRKEKYRGWLCLRDGNIALNPLDVLWGSPKYHYTDHGPKRHALVNVGEFAGDEYLVDFQLRYQQRHRDDGPRWARRPTKQSFTYDAECRPGIPVRNHDWKGDEILGWGGSVGEWVPGSPRGGMDWLPLAVADTIRIVKRDRRRYDYRPPKQAVL